MLRSASFFHTLGGLLLLSVFFAAAAPPVAGQDLDITPGAKVGLGFMTHGGEDAADELEGRTGLVLGGFATVDFDIAAPVALRPELAYVQKGATRIVTDEDVRVTSPLRTNYIELQLLGMYRPPYRPPIANRVSPILLAGPVLGYNVWATVEDQGLDQSPTTNVRDQIRPMEFGLAVGGGIDVAVSGGTVTIDLRYELGLTSLYDGDATVRNQGVIVTAGVSF